VFDWDGTVYIEPEDPSIYVSPGSVNINNGSVTRPIAFINNTGSDVITNVNLSYENILVKVGSDITVYEVQAPADVEDFTATAWDEQIKLEWTNPLDSDFAGVKLLMKEDGYPFNALDGELLYDGSGQWIDTPVQVVGEGGAGVLEDVVAIAAGMYHTVALKKDGIVWTWRSNENGQLGDNNYGVNSEYPVQVT